jgi:hypothetical protein
MKLRAGLNLRILLSIAALLAIDGSANAHCPADGQKTWREVASTGVNYTFGELLRIDGAGISHKIAALKSESQS